MSEKLKEMLIKFPNLPLETKALKIFKTFPKNIIGPGKNPNGRLPRNKSYVFPNIEIVFISVAGQDSLILL